MASLNTLKKDELVSLAESNDVEVTEDDTRETLIEKLKDSDVEAPSDGDSGDKASPEERPASLNDVSERMAGGTPGGASESQQPPSVSKLPGVGAVEQPDLDEVTALGVRPLYAGPRNPALEYDDDAKG